MFVLCLVLTSNHLLFYFAFNTFVCILVQDFTYKYIVFWKYFGLWFPITFVNGVGYNSTWIIVICPASSPWHHNPKIRKFIYCFLLTWVRAAKPIGARTNPSKTSVCALVQRARHLLRLRSTQVIDPRITLVCFAYFVFIVNQFLNRMCWSTSEIIGHQTQLYFLRQTICSPLFQLSQLDLTACGSSLGWRVFVWVFSKLLWPQGNALGGRTAKYWGRDGSKHAGDGQRDALTRGTLPHLL